MVGLLKNRANPAVYLRIRIVFFVMLIGIAGLLYTTCNSAMGLGNPIDTKAPSITIVSPKDSEFMRGIAVGEPIQMSGFCKDEFGVTELKVRVLNVITGEVIIPRFDYIINTEETWSASLYLPGDGVAEYRIRVSALDNFRNEGADEVTVRVDIVAPWVREASIVRHSIFSSGLKEAAFYENLNFRSSNMYKNIQLGNIDDFQNEAFTVSLVIDSNMDSVAAARLDVYGEDGVKLNPLPLKPTRSLTERTPEWRITAADLEGWHAKYATGAHYIYFVAMAWNSTSWDPNGTGYNGGGTVPNEVHREQRISGTSWYPQSDYPQINLTADISGGFITLTPDTDRAMALQFFDDDKLSEVYAAIVTKSRMDLLRGTRTEAEYMEFLAANQAERDSVISGLELANLYNPAASPDSRYQVINLSTGQVGEYRLLALVKDDKNAPLDTINTALWTAHVPLRIQVQDPNDPIIIVESPAFENSFPALTGGRKFAISGFTIDTLGVDAVQIAWIPANSGISVEDAQQALLDASLSDGASVILGNQLKIWRLAKGSRSTMTLNNVNYLRDNYSQEFDIVDDFMFDGGDGRGSRTQNDHKLFVIHAKKGSRNIFKNFSLTGNTERPAIEVLYPYRDMLVHDTKEALNLRMRVTSAIGIKPDSIKILDKSVGNADENRGMSNMVNSGGVYERTITASTIASTFPEGTRLMYHFVAEDLLGVSNIVERTIIMSNLPALQYVTSSNSSGSYGIGSELRFEAVFSLPVRVNKQGGTGPRLKLYFINPGTGEPAITASTGAYAEYVDSPAGNTVVFTYKVKEGDVANLLYTSLSPIVLNGSTMESTGEEGTGDAILVLQQSANGGLQGRVQIQLDGIPPRVEMAGFSPVNGQIYFNNGKTVTLELVISEPVRVSGTPTAVINYRNNNIAGNIQVPFSKVETIGGTSTLFFSEMVNVGNAVPQAQLSWGDTVQASDKWIQFLGIDSITDMAGNNIDLRPATVASLTPGHLNGLTNNNKVAYIITSPPAAPTFTLYSDDARSTVLSGDRANNNIYLTVSGAAGTDLYYSFDAGNNQNLLQHSYEVITDKNRSNRANSNYVPSEYKITAWQVDLAGNRSPNAAERSVTINSRAPELVDITCTEPNGSYSQGKDLTFKLVFSRNVRATAAGATLTLKGNAASPYDGQSNPIQLVSTTPSNPLSNNNTFSTSLTFVWRVPPNLRMRDIKATAINLSNVVDEYGNSMPDFILNLVTETVTQRPIAMASLFNLQRGEGLVVNSFGPGIISSTPSAPATTGVDYNGGQMEKTPETSGVNTGKIVDGKIVLTFDEPVWANSGKYITIRPYNNWAIPPILTIEEMENLYNSPLFGDNRTEYQRRLKWIDANGLPELGGRATSDAFVQRTTYNSYVYTTHGLVSGTGGLARPDTSGKWVLAFDRDLYTGVQNLRDVFNAAQWKWQVISVTSGSVVINNSAKTVTITLPQPLEKGRIWEILIDAGAFRDLAGNETAAVTSNTPNYNSGTGFRFWSKGTSDPVIRVDRYSHGENYHGLPDSFRGHWSQRPYIDTMVRIDCETPGASIRYDTYRTRYVLNPGQNGTTSDAFTSTYDTSATFFRHTNISVANGSADTGYTNNRVGNGGSHASSVMPPLENGFFNGLLVPNVDITDGNAALANNGTLAYTTITARGATLTNGTNLSTTNGLAYRTIVEAGTATWGTPVFEKTATAAEPAAGRFFYAGDAYTTGTGALNNRDASSDTDLRLFSGRRDYVMAAAQKPLVTTAGEIAGPLLAVSEPSYEGVYKTTVLQREPANGCYWVTVQGFDTPMAPSTPGFPLQEYIATPASPYNTVEHLYFSRQMWRVSGVRINNTAGTNLTSNTVGSWPTAICTGNMQANLQRDNNHIWVSWDIVTDWYLKGRNRTQGATTTSHDSGRLQRAGYNYGAVLATYGAVTYRYRQNFDNAYTGTTQ